MKRLLNQYNPLWAGHALGSVAGELGPFGCNVVACNMVVADAFGDMDYTPDKFDDVLQSRGQFNGDLLNEYALDHVWPDRFTTTHYDSFRLDICQALVSSYSTTDYIKLWLSGVYSPLWRMVIGTHFVVLLRADGYIADPAGGVIRSILDYGGWGAVKGMAHIHRIAPAVIVVPAVVPVVVKPVVPPPVPTFSIRARAVELATGLTYAAAMTLADTDAAAQPGTLYEILDGKGAVVGTGFRAVLPAPVIVPILAKPTTAPAHVQQPNFWAILQTVLIQLLSRFSRR